MFFNTIFFSKLPIASILLGFARKNKLYDLALENYSSISLKSDPH